MITRLLACSLLALLASGCSDDGPSACESFTFAACGGDVVGTWGGAILCPTGSESRSEPISDDPACVDSRMATTTWVSSITYVFNADGTYTMTEITAGSGTLRVDADCVAVEAPGYTLQQACDEIDAEPGATCSVSGEICTCRYSNTDTNDGAGSYAINGNSITLGWQTVEFCVSGDQLELATGDIVDGQTHVLLHRQ